MYCREIYLKSHEYDQMLTALGYTHITDTVRLEDLLQHKTDNFLDSVNPFGYTLVFGQQKDFKS